MIEPVFILTFFPFTFSLAQRNTSSAQKRGIKSKVSRVQKKNLLCTRALFLAIFRTQAWERSIFSGPSTAVPGTGGGWMCLPDPWGDAQSPGEGTKPCPGQEARCPPRSKVLALLLGDSCFLPTLLPTCPCLLAQSSGSIDLSVPSRTALQDQPRAMGQLRERQPRLSSLSSRRDGVWSECPALFLQGFTVHTSICLPPPLPSLPLSLFLSDASRKRKFMEAVPRAVFPALVLVGACSWLAQPSLASARLHNSFTSHKRWIMLPFTCCLPGPSPQSWWVHPWTCQVHAAPCASSEG